MSDMIDVVYKEVTGRRTIRKIRTQDQRPSGQKEMCLSRLSRGESILSNRGNGVFFFLTEEYGMPRRNHNLD